MGNANEKSLQPTATVEPKASENNHHKYTTLLNSMQEGTHMYNILHHLIQFGSITSLEAIAEYGDTRLSSTIYKLKKLNVKITTHTESNTNRFGKKVSYGRYQLEQEN